MSPRLVTNPAPAAPAKPPSSPSRKAPQPISNRRHSKAARSPRPSSPPRRQFPAAFTASPPSGVPEEIWSSRDEVVYSLGLNSDGRLLAGTGNNGSLARHRRSRRLRAACQSRLRRKSPESPRCPTERSICAPRIPEKYFLSVPSTKPKAPSNRNPSTPNFSRSGDASNGGVLQRQLEPAKNAKDSKEPRLELFVRSGNTEDPGKEWSPWFGPYTSTDAQVESAARSFPPMESGHPRRPPRRRNRLGQRRLLARQRCTGHRWNRHAGSGRARASSRGHFGPWAMWR